MDVRILAAKYRHGMCGTRIYNIWRDMRHRCNCQGMKNYPYYGGRGISVCEEWDNSFEAFYDWAMSNGYSDDLTIDRIDTDGNYEPSNCRWATKAVQSANRRSIGKCEYIGVYKHSNGSSYIAEIKKDGNNIFYYSSRSKNDCAVKRNEFISSYDLEYPLNVIKDEYEDVCIHKNELIYRAIEKDSGKIYSDNSLKGLSKQLGLTRQFVSQCLRGKRNSKKFVFEKEGLHGSNSGGCREQGREAYSKTPVFLSTRYWDFTGAASSR